jgi:hypothetical protein
VQPLVRLRAASTAKRWPSISIPRWKDGPLDRAIAPLAVACVRWGYSLPIATAQLQSMYASRTDFYSAFVRTSKANYLAGYMLLLDVLQDAGEAMGADIGR